MPSAVEAEEEDDSSSIIGVIVGIIICLLLLVGFYFWKKENDRKNATTNFSHFATKYDENVNRQECEDLGASNSQYGRMADLQEDVPLKGVGSPTSPPTGATSPTGPTGPTGAVGAAAPQQASQQPHGQVGPVKQRGVI